MPASEDRQDQRRLFFVLVFLARFHAFFHMVNSSINGFDGLNTMSSFIVFGFL
jgi:hypothetical protein